MPEAHQTNDQEQGQNPEANASHLLNPSEKFKERIRYVVSREEEIKDKRAELNAEKKALREGLVADFAINKEAFDAAISYVDSKDKKKVNWDLTYQAVREALGEPVQKDLFTEGLRRDMQDAVDEHQGKKPRKH